MTDGDLSIEEKRVYGDRTGATEAYLASGAGVVRVLVSDDRVGEFDLCHRCTARDVATGGGSVVVAAEGDVLLAPDGATFAGTGFGPAVAVGIHDGRVVAAAPDGRVARRHDDGWRDLGDAPDVRAIDAGFVAAADGVHRIVDDGLRSVGLDDARDVAGRGVPLAATGGGLFALGNGWLDVREGPHTVVESDGERAHAVGPDGLVGRDGVGADWAGAALPAGAGTVVGLAYGPGQVVAVTEGGRVLATVGDGWRSQLVGVPGVAAVAVR